MNNFKIKLEEVFRQLGVSNTMVLATSLNNRVSARMMSFIMKDGKFYFQTDTAFHKYEDILGNANVALCKDNIQIEGNCKEIGKPMEIEWFKEMYSTYHSSSFQAYSSLENTRVFEITPVFIQRWNYVDGNPFIEKYELKEERLEIIDYLGVSK